MRDGGDGPLRRWNSIETLPTGRQVWLQLSTGAVVKGFRGVGETDPTACWTFDRARRAHVMVQALRWADIDGPMPPPADAVHPAPEAA